MFKKDIPFLTEKTALRLLSLSAILYIFVFYSWCWLKFTNFSYDDFDLAIHDQIVWNILHGSLFNSILGFDFLGNHVHFISFLVAPFYWFCPSPLFLLFIQTLFLAAGVFPLYGIARIYLDRHTSLIIGIIYLLYPGLGYTNLFEFHPTCFAVFFLLCALYYFYKENFPVFNVYMVLSLLCQENIALIFIMWGIYALLLKRRLKWVLWPTCLGLLYFTFCVYIVLPKFNKNNFDFFYIYAPLGNSLLQVAQTCIFHPGKVLPVIFQARKIHFLHQLFVSAAYLPLLSPLTMLPAFLIFMQHLLSNRTGESSIYFHYTAELIPFIFVSFVFGFKKIIQWTGDFKSLIYIVLVAALTANFTYGPLFTYLEDINHLQKRRYISDQNEALLGQIPKNVPVVTTFHFLSHLSHSQDLYSFHYVYSNHYTFSDKPFPLPDQVNYALIDFNDILTFIDFYRPGRYSNLTQFLPGHFWGSMDVQDSVVLFKKGAVSRCPLFNLTDKPVPVTHPQNVIVDNRLQLYGYDLSERSDRIHLIFYWKLLGLERKDVNIFIDFIDQNGNIIDKQFRPICYRIWPTQAWVIDQSIEDHQYISIPPAIKGRLKALMIGFYDYRTGKAMPTDSKNGLVRINVNLT